jgi:HTH-type transcriptional regulator/antitoxin HipB
MPTISSKLVDLDDFINNQYGARGTAARETFEEGYEAFKLGAMLWEMRKENNMTQEQLAAKCGTTKTYISHIENNASDLPPRSCGLCGRTWVSI